MNMHMLLKIDGVEEREIFKMKNKYTKEEVIKLLNGAQSNIIRYENNIRLEKEQIKRIQEECPHEYIDFFYPSNTRICLICGFLEEDNVYNR